MRRIILLLIAWGISAFSLIMFHSGYWRHRNLFNEEGRYFDAVEGVVFHAQSGMVWAGISVIFIFATLFLQFIKR